MKTCPKCGEEYSYKYEFCVECGSKLGDVKSKKKKTRKEGEKAARAPRALRSPFDEFVVGGVALMVGLLVCWAFAIFGMAVPSVLQTVPTEIRAFLPQFFVFLVVGVIGLYAAKWGADEMGNPKPAAGVLKYSGILMLVVAGIVLAMRWGSGFQVTDPTFWFRMAYVFGMIGMGLYSLIAARRVRER